MCESQEGAPFHETWRGGTSRSLVDKEVKFTQYGWAQSLGGINWVDACDSVIKGIGNTHNSGAQKRNVKMSKSDEI